MEIEMTLEEPPQADAPMSTLQSLGGEGGASPLEHVKLAMMESFLGMTTRDIPYSDFLREMLFAVMKAVSCEAASFLEVDHQNQQLFFRSCTGRVSDQVLKFVIPIGTGLAGHVAQSQEHLVVHQAQENKQHLKAIGDAVGFEAKNLVAFPIVIRGTVYGVIELINRTGEENFTESDVELMKYLCNAMAKCIEMRLMLAWSLKAA